MWRGTNKGIGGIKGIDDISGIGVDNMCFIGLDDICSRRGVDDISSRRRVDDICGIRVDDISGMGVINDVCSRRSRWYRWYKRSRLYMW